jgi:hypothetical protein
MDKVDVEKEVQGRGWLGRKGCKGLNHNAEREDKGRMREGSRILRQLELSALLPRQTDFARALADHVSDRVRISTKTLKALPCFRFAELSYFPFLQGRVLFAERSRPFPSAPCRTARRFAEFVKVVR